MDAWSKENSVFASWADPTEAGQRVLWRVTSPLKWSLYWEKFGDFPVKKCNLASGKLLHNYGKPPFLMGKSTISMAIFNSYVKLPEGILRNRSFTFHMAGRVPKVEGTKKTAEEAG